MIEHQTLPHNVEKLGMVLDLKYQEHYEAKNIKFFPVTDAKALSVMLSSYWEFPFFNLSDIMQKTNSNNCFKSPHCKVAINSHFVIM